jgi:signal peptidase I
LTDTTTTAATEAKAKPETSWLGELRNLALLLLAVFAIHSFIAKPFYIPSASMMPGLIEGDRLVVSKYPYGWSFASISFHLAPPFSGRLFASYPARGDVVIVEPNGVREDYIKRVIGLPGDTIEMRNSHLFLNGVEVKREILADRRLPFDANQRCESPLYPSILPNGTRVCDAPVVRETLSDGTFYDTIDSGNVPCIPQLPCGDNYAPYRVPAGHVFLMGDNRDDSSDSRFPLSAAGLGGAVPLENIGGRAELITFSLDGSAVWWNPISWFTAMRSGRAGMNLRPSRTTPPPVAAPVASAASQ